MRFANPSPGTEGKSKLADLDEENTPSKFGAKDTNSADDQNRKLGETFECEGVNQVKIGNRARKNKSTRTTATTDMNRMVQTPTE